MVSCNHSCHRQYFANHIVLVIKDLDMIDIRFPIGLMFTVFGLIISVFGLVTEGNSAMYEKSLNVNVNLLSGLLMLAFGLIMLFFSEPVRRRLKRNDKTGN